MSTVCVNSEVGVVTLNQNPFWIHWAKPPMPRLNIAFAPFAPPYPFILIIGRTHFSEGCQTSYWEAIISYTYEKHTWAPATSASCSTSPWTNWLVCKIWRSPVKSCTRFSWTVTSNQTGSNNVLYACNPSLLWPRLFIFSCMHLNAMLYHFGIVFIMMGANYFHSTSMHLYFRFGRGIFI